MNMNYPKISIVTPSYNQAKYLNQTILSILDQNYPNLEYIIIDGGSTDGSVEIIRRFEDRLAYWESEPDKGMYHALQKGFERTTGEIMGWLNSDDMLHRNALFTIAEVLTLQEVKWVQGIPTGYDEYDRCIYVSSLKFWSKFKFWQGDFQWIQQESTYWHRDLWEKAGGYVSQNYKYAGDMELWNRFFKYDKLYCINALVGGYRMRSSNQLALEFLPDYLKEAEHILTSNNFDNLTQQTLYQVKKIKQNLINVNANMTKRILNHIKIKILKRSLEILYDYPPMISFDRNKQKFFIQK